MQHGPTGSARVTSSASTASTRDAALHAPCRRGRPATPPRLHSARCIRAEVGDTIQVVFRNNTSIRRSVHPHGVFYHKDSEGAPYADGTSGADKARRRGAAGGDHTYTWQVPERAGPGPMDGSSVMWMYHSHTDEVADTYAGLHGSDGHHRARAMARARRHAQDVDREVFVAIHRDEREQQPVPRPTNIAAVRGEPAGARRRGRSRSATSCTPSTATSSATAPADVRRGERVRWYVMSHGHRGRPAHAALARQHRHGQRDAHGHGEPAARLDGRRPTWSRTTRAPGCSTATSTTTSPPG